MVLPVTPSVPPIVVLPVIDALPVLVKVPVLVRPLVAVAPQTVRPAAVAVLAVAQPMVTLPFELTLKPFWNTGVAVVTPVVGLYDAVPPIPPMLMPVELNEPPVPAIVPGTVVVPAGVGVLGMVIVYEP